MLARLGSPRVPHPGLRHSFPTNALTDQNDPVTGPRHPKDADGDLLDHIGMRWIGPKKEHVAKQLGRDGLEVSDLPVQSAGTLVKLGPCLEAVLARDRVMDEVGRYR
jgi:hypothetical protein